MIIDKKFQVIAFNPISRKQYTEEDGVFFRAGDKALANSITAYVDACIALDADYAQVTSAKLLADRIRRFHYLTSVDSGEFTYYFPDSCEKDPPFVIDRKFEILAIRISNGEELTDKDGMFFCAKDAALVPFLLKYMDSCIQFGLDERAQATIILIQQVQEYQRLIACKVPDLNGMKEVENCLRNDACPFDPDPTLVPQKSAEEIVADWETTCQVTAAPLPLDITCDESPDSGSFGSSNIDSQVVPDELSEELNPPGSIGIDSEFGAVTQDEVDRDFQNTWVADDNASVDEHAARGMTPTSQHWDDSAFQNTEAAEDNVVPDSGPAKESEIVEEDDDSFSGCGNLE